MTPIAALILALLTVGISPLGPMYAPHIARHPLGPELRAEMLAEQYELASAVTGVRVERLIALGFGESYLDHAAKGPRVRGRRAIGIAQLFPSNPHYAAWRHDCSRDAYACEQSSVTNGAMALRDSLRACRGGFACAVSHYRGNGYVPRAKDEAVAALSRTLAWRLKHASARRIVMGVQ